MIKKNILIATGGTGGHIFPACSLANYLALKDINIILTTDKRGAKYLKGQNFYLKELPLSPLKKDNILKFIFSLIIITFSIIKSFIYLLFNRPSIIFGMGGYSSFPICIAAIILRIKFVIYENNLIIGKANKYLLPFTNKIFVSYRELEGIPEKYNDKVVVIGNLIREEIFKSASLGNLSYDSLKVLVLGGSQGASIFAEELPFIFKKLKNNKKPIQIYQQCRKEQSEKLSEFYKKASIEHEIFHFSNKITDYYSKVNLVITRSGASVLGELINLKIPFISIPLPTSADNHQYKNAEFYLKKGYGYLLEEKDIKNKLYELINSILKNDSTIKNILISQKEYSDKNTFRNLFITLENILNEKN